MSYEKQTWNNQSYVNPTRMNHIEDGIDNAYNYDNSTSGLSANTVQSALDEVNGKIPKFNTVKNLYSKGTPTSGTYEIQSIEDYSFIEIKIANSENSKRVHSLVLPRVTISNNQYYHLNLTFNTSYYLSVSVKFVDNTHIDIMEPVANGYSFGGFYINGIK